jgi:hypothetical protein
MTKDHYEEKYTDPELRRRLKDQIMQSDKGGEPGQWSARKSQLLVQEYEKHGGGYKKAEKDDAARSLEEWGNQDWQTETGDDRARQGNVTKRYLPKKVWESLSESEKAEAERIKEEASQKGEQHVEWTPAVKQAMYEMEKTEMEKTDHQDDTHSRREPKPKAVQEPFSEPDSASMTKEALYEQAKDLNISGRSKMNREELLQAIQEASD